MGFLFIFLFMTVSGKVARPMSANPPQPQKAKQFVQAQPVAKRTSLRPSSSDLPRSSSMGFLNQV